MTDNTEALPEAAEDVPQTPKEQRITKKRLHEFIEATEDALFQGDDAIPKCWQDLRLFAGLDRLTEGSLAERRAEELRKKIATKKATVEDVQEFAALVVQSGS